MIKRPLIAGLALALWAALSVAEQQSPLPQTVGVITTQNLTPSGANTVGSAVCADVSAAGAVTVQTQGTYTGALSATVSNDGLTRVTLGGSSTFIRLSNAATSATIGSGVQDVFQVGTITGVRSFCVTALGAVTGSVTVTLQPALSAAAGSTNITGGGDATAANQAAGNASLASIDGKLPALASGRVPITDLTAVAQGSTTSGQSGNLIQCATTTSAPTYTTAQTNPISCDTSGAVRITGSISAGGVAQGSTTSGQTGNLTQAAVTTAAPSYTTGQTSPLSLDTSGSLRVAIMSGAGSGGTASTVGSATPSTATAIGGNDGTNMQVPRVADLDSGGGTQYALITSPRLAASGGGVELVGGAGAVSAGVLRTTQASDSPLVSAAGAPADSVCGTDTGTCGQIALLKKIAQNLSTSNVQLPADGTGQVTMANSFPVVLASDHSNVPTNIAQINGVTPLMGSGNTGTGSHRVTVATDQPAHALHGHGATGAAVPANAQLAGGRSGANMVAMPVMSSTVAVSMSTATTTQMVALSGSTQIYVGAYSIISAGTTNVTFVYGTGTNCGTGTTSLTGAIPLVANSGTNLAGPVVMVVPAGQALCVTNSAGVQISGHITYTQY